MPGIFISYRRSDNPDAVGRIYDRLVSEFGKARVFKDVDSIPLGQDFRGHLNDVVGGCSAVLAIIGPRWTDARTAAGQRRLDDVDDFVRIELEAALARNIPVVPVLVGHATMPGTADLPSSLASMVYRQAIEVRPDPDFHHDSTRLVAALQRILDPNAPDMALRSNRWRTWMTALAAIMFVSGLGLAIASWYGLRSRPLPEIRTEISTPEADRPQDYALSPDGSQIAFAARDGEVTRLWLRPLDSEVARPLRGTEGAMDPFWSPDSKSIGYFTTEALMRLDLVSGLAREIVKRKGSAAGGGSWSEAGFILYSSLPDGILQVPAAGGEAVSVTRPGSTTERHVGPFFLPDGRHFIYSQVGSVGGTGAIYLGSTQGGAPVKLVDSANRGKYLSSGWLVWERNRTLLAQRLDLKKSSLIGDVVTIADRTAGFAGNSASVADNGLIAFRRGGENLRQLQWLDRAGVVLGTVGDPDPSYGDPRVSPDGQRIAVDRAVQGNYDVWVIDGPRQLRVTSGEGLDVWGVWYPNGRSLAFASTSTIGTEIFRRSTDGAGTEIQLTESGGFSSPVSISPDGRYLLFERGDATFYDASLFLQPLEGGGKSSPWLHTKFIESMGDFSPDGRWVAYCSNAGGSMEVYIRPFHPPAQGVVAEGPEAQWQVSVSGGSSPTWRSDGREIYFLGPKGEMMAAQVSATGTGLSSGTPVRLFETHLVDAGINACGSREYDVSPDGRFLVNTELDTGAPSPIVLIQNWNPEATHTSR